ncbi:RNA polymerase sigma factor [Cellulomonas sp. S1-8]|uniref:RNA polymerase sigma factor n=1 Tax=Cellulomonas sp. S1-8 TaxID=2904790 RepID=UPI002242DC29|nr:sigma-70 family RNA polymerase sigma factor [Cellulomonas sp. S1-8]UZN01505.1 sigma-70 family RNA polymerase sigma factor [Cellulomonas sp. S1-8]
MTGPFEDVVRAHGGTVLRVCRAVLGAGDADDAWSETFVAALRAWPDLPADANVEAWLVTVARRKSIDELRRRARHAVPVGDVAQWRGEPLVGVLPGPGDHDLDLWRAVGTLPDRQRRAVVLHHLGGLPYAEVARLVGGTDTAARRAGADGVATLRRTYGAAAPRRTSGTTTDDQGAS